LEYLDPRDVWPHEAHDFTPWLLANGDRLAEVLGIDIELTSNEHPVGDFNVDLIGRDLTNDCPLVVENQLTLTNHDHLGKVVTYSAGTDAKTIVWMATAFREEHRQALDWLNALAQGNARFFGIEIQAVRIAGSPPAPLLQLRAQPNDWHAQVATAAKATAATAGKGAMYVQFWTRYLERVHQEHPGWTNARKPGTSNWLAMPSPFKGGPFYSASFTGGSKMRHELYIDAVDPAYVEALYQFLETRREAIEASYGRPLAWEPLPDRRASRVADYRDGDVANAPDHEAYIDWLFDAGVRLRAALTEPAKEWAAGP
jgi:hypothetical protein